MKDEHDSLTMSLPGINGLTPDQVLEDLKDEWRETIEGDGGCCPLCGKFGKIYKTKLGAGLTLALKWIADHGGQDGWVDVQVKGPRWMLRSKTYPLLTHWNFLESRQHRSGEWRITDRGRDFINGQILAPLAVFIYDNKKVAVSEETITFRESLELKFDFDELMSSQFRWENLSQVEKKNAKRLQTRVQDAS